LSPFLQTLIYLKCDDKPLSDDPLDRHVLAVNASPLERGHSLVVPCINKCLPQVSIALIIKRNVPLAEVDP
jgi:hypothetical protein